MSPGYFLEKIIDGENLTYAFPTTRLYQFQILMLEFYFVKIFYLIWHDTLLSCKFLQRQITWEVVTVVLSIATLVRILRHERSLGYASLSIRTLKSCRHPITTPEHPHLYPQIIFFNTVFTKVVISSVTEIS